MENIGCNLLLRWAASLALDAPVWDATTFSRNRERPVDGEVGQRLPAAALARPRVRALMSDEDFSVDGRLIQAWWPPRRFQPKAKADKDDKRHHRMPLLQERMGAMPSKAGAGRRAATTRTKSTADRPQHAAPAASGVQANSH